MIFYQPISIKTNRDLMPFHLGQSLAQRRGGLDKTTNNLPTTTLHNKALQLGSLLLFLFTNSLDIGIGGGSGRGCAGGVTMDKLGFYGGQKSYSIPIQ